MYKTSDICVAIPTLEKQDRLELTETQYYILFLLHGNMLK